MTSAELPITGHIDELRRRGIRTLIVLTIITIICLSFGLKSFTVVLSLPPGISSPNFTSDSRSTDPSVVFRFYYPYPNPFENIAVQLTLLLKEYVIATRSQVYSNSPRTSIFCPNSYFAALEHNVFNPNNSERIFCFYIPCT